MHDSITKIKFGKYEGILIRDVPHLYLLNLYNSLLKAKVLNINHKSLIEYIEKNNIFKNKNNDKIEIAVHGNQNKLMCKDSGKIIFISEKDAKFEIKRIRDLEQENKKPVRTYGCEKCGGWHLTSISFEKWELIK